MKICASNSGALARQQRQGDAICQQDAGRSVIDRDPDPDRPLARQAGDRHQASHALGDLVDPGPPFIGAVLAEPGDAAVDDARVDLLHRVVIDP